jgi:hypothetical protein
VVPQSGGELANRTRRFFQFQQKGVFRQSALGAGIRFGLSVNAQRLEE